MPKTIELTDEQLNVLHNALLDSESYLRRMVEAGSIEQADADVTLAENEKVRKILNTSGLSVFLVHRDDIGGEIDIYSDFALVKQALSALNGDDPEGSAYYTEEPVLNELLPY